MNKETLSYQSNLILSDDSPGLSPLKEDIVIDFQDIGFSEVGITSPCFRIVIPNESIVLRNDRTFGVSDPKNSGATARIEDESGTVVFADLTDTIEFVDLSLKISGSEVNISVDVVSIIGIKSPCFRPIASSSGHKLIFSRTGIINFGGAFSEDLSITMSGGVLGF